MWPWIPIELQWISLKIVIGSWSIFSSYTLSLWKSTRWKVICVTAKTHRYTQFDPSSILWTFINIHGIINGIHPTNDIGEESERYGDSSNVCGKCSGVCNVQGVLPRCIVAALEASPDLSPGPWAVVECLALRWLRNAIRNDPRSWFHDITNCWDVEITFSINRINRIYK